MQKIIGIILIIGIVIVGGIAAIFMWNKNDATSDEVDVVVVGGEPEGVAAAISAARNGASVILIEHWISILIYFEANPLCGFALFLVF